MDTGHRPKLGSGRLLLRISIGLVLVFAIASAVAIYFKQEGQMQRMRQQREILASQLAAAKANQAALQELQVLVDTDEYIERIARDKLGLVRPHEIVFED